MFPIFGNCINSIEPAVHTTGVPLSERFKSVPSHNPFRPNEVKKLVPNFSFADVEISPKPDVSTDFRGPVQGEHATGGGINKLAVLRATKDAEILRLRAQVQAMRTQLGPGRGFDMEHNGKRDFDALRTIQKPSMKNRSGNFRVEQRGSEDFVARQYRGKRLTLQSTDAFSILGVDKVLRDPRSNAGRIIKGARNDKFFGTPKSKRDLDKELDSYMAKSKSKQKTDLDNELDEYMRAARLQSFAGRVGLFEPTTPPPETVDSDEMEIAE